MRRKMKNKIGLIGISFLLISGMVYGETVQDLSYNNTNALAYDEDINYPYISGYGDGTFKPEQAVTREELATMLARIITKNRIPDEENRYQDMIEGRFSTNAVNYITQLGIMKATNHHTFKPTNNVSIKEFNEVVEQLSPYIKNNDVTLPTGKGFLTRSQVVITLNDLFNVQCNTYHTSAPFKDIKPGSPEYEAILCATQPQGESVP
ncbi:MAG: S-layer homology domain-containing protein [Cellulosilyticum sp.]|nr:S-layer homology domain-containing protein [Cellulosilyticum sp.]